MGVFDYVKCDYPLPWPEAKEFGFAWQSKDTPSQYCDRYELREDGTLWLEKFVVHREGDSLMSPGRREHLGWAQELLDGVGIEIYHGTDAGWYSVRFWFRDNRVADMVAKFTPKDSSQC